MFDMHMNSQERLILEGTAIFLGVFGLGGVVFAAPSPFNWIAFGMTIIVLIMIGCMYYYARQQRQGAEENIENLLRDMHEGEEGEES